MTANGNRPNDNNYIVDGLDDNDAYYGTTVINAEGVEGTPATHLPIDAIQEFNVQSSPEADYGWKPGAIINIGIKSGTNSFHGSTYYFNRNSALDARNWFNPDPDPIAALNFHQFGASAGGPIVKNKLFIFGNYEGVRDVVGNPLDRSMFRSRASTGDPDDSIADAFALAPRRQLAAPPVRSWLHFFRSTPGRGLTAESGLQQPQSRGQRNPEAGLPPVGEKQPGCAPTLLGDSVQTEEDTTVMNPLFLSQSKTGPRSLAGAGSGRRPRGSPTNSGLDTTVSGNR